MEENQKFFTIKLDNQTELLTDEDGFILIFDSPEQIQAWAESRNIDLDRITYYEDELLEETDEVFYIE